MARKRRKRIYCPNCGTQLKEHMNFCHNCGQENHIKRVSVKMLAGDFVSSYFTVDSKVFRSLKYLLIKPSFLSLEYLNGKIEAYLRPIRLYVFISFAFFLILGLTTSSNDPASQLNLKQDGKPVTFEELKEKAEDEVDEKTKTTANYDQQYKSEDTFFGDWDKELERKLETIFTDKREGQLFVNYLISKLPIFLFMMLPVLGFLFFIFFYKKDYYYVDHLVFAMHLQSFFFVLLIITKLINFFLGYDLDPLAVLGFFVYGFIAARKFYKRKKIGTFFRLSLVGFFHSIFSVITLSIFFVILIKYYNV